jgi:hypothetical protein
MTTPLNPYRDLCFPVDVIEHAVWLYHCFSLSLRDVETILTACGVVVSYDSPLGKGHRIVSDASSRPMEANRTVAAETWVSVSSSILRRREMVRAPILCSTHIAWAAAQSPSRTLAA